ncbi:alpha-(1,3)-fucosyltransferase C-like [Watersipora subatra]|uniref:alpha-(1,3)-fucosyltransferase C-like n=1 Tax=Watersipora subatra TaxID=2589382 RepID=UPI00355BAC00
MDGHWRESLLKFVHTEKHKCRLESGRNDSQGADVLIFGNGEVSHFRSPPHKGQNDLWVFLSKEPQIKLKNRRAQLQWNGLFNYSVTFDRNTDASYHIFRPILKSIYPAETRYYKPWTQKKLVRALWMVSHCTTTNHHQNIFSARERYAVELSKHFPIEVFTSNLKNCGWALKDLEGSIHENENPNMSDYMFYLSFENNLCQDYITEKFWKILESDDAMIPIALGGLSIEDYNTIAPPNSFIHVKNFSSPEALANHLKYIAKEPDAFNYYHQWRNSYRLNRSHHVSVSKRTLMYHGGIYSIS